MLALVLGLATWMSEPIELRWQAPESCPSEAEVLDRLLEQTPVVSSSTLRVSATIEIREGEFVVDLVLANADGKSERSFPAKDCATLTDAIVLVVGVTVEEFAAIHASEQPQAEPEPEPEPVPKPEPEPASEPAPASEPEPSADMRITTTEPPSPPLPFRVGLRAFGGGGYGPTRGGHGSVGGELALFGDRWRWKLGADWSIPRKVDRDAMARGTFDAWAIHTHGCFVPVAARVLELPLCVGIAAGQVRGRGLEPLLVTRQASLAWVAPSLGQGLWWVPIERFAIGVELQMFVPLTRGRFVIGDVEIDRIAAIGVRGLAGIEVRLP